MQSLSMEIMESRKLIVQSAKDVVLVSVTCPSNAIVQNHFTSEELLAEINGLTPWQNYIKE